MWLIEDFVRDADTRANFLSLVERGDFNGEAMSSGFAELAGELGGWLEEKRRMQAELPAQATRPFGGLTWEEMEALVRRYEARTLGLNVFLLARDWRKAGEAARRRPSCSKPELTYWTRRFGRVRRANSQNSATPWNFCLG